MTTAKAMPGSAGMCMKNVSRASRPPAEAPNAAIKNCSECPWPCPSPLARSDGASGLCRDVDATFFFAMTSFLVFRMGDFPIVLPQTPPCCTADQLAGQEPAPPLNKLAERRTLHVVVLFGGQLQWGRSTSRSNCLFTLIQEPIAPPNSDGFYS